MEKRKEKPSFTALKSSRRAVVKGAAAAVPAVMTMASKPALGAACNISGFTSVTPSGQQRHGTNTDADCGGLSHGAWKNPDAGNGAGSRADWINIGLYPNPQDNQDPAGTLFSAVFETPSTTPGSTLHDVLLKTGGGLIAFEREAVTAYLNALHFGWGTIHPEKMSPSDIVNLHYAVTGGPTTFITTNGNTVNIGNYSIEQLKDFLEDTHH